MYGDEKKHLTWYGRKEWASTDQKGKPIAGFVYRSGRMQKCVTGTKEKSNGRDRTGFEPHAICSRPLGLHVPVRPWAKWAFCNLTHTASLWSGGVGRNDVCTTYAYYHKCGQNHSVTSKLHGIMQGPTVKAPRSSSALWERLEEVWRILEGRVQVSFGRTFGNGWQTGGIRTA